MIHARINVLAEVRAILGFFIRRFPKNQFASTVVNTDATLRKRVDTGEHQVSFTPSSFGLQAVGINKLGIGIGSAKR